MSTKRWWLACIAILSTHYYAFSQGFTVSGTLLDETDNSALIGVNVVLSPTSDTTQKLGGVTDLDGLFAIPNLPQGEYNLEARYVGFQNLTRTLNVSEHIDLGTIRMKVLSTQLQNVTVTAEQIRAQQSGDTTSFNAGAYKTNPDATAEDLINKMPGITTEGGTIKAQGEDVRQVLVDGKPFFGDDPNAAIKNLPAEIIDRIQVFDKLSDQAQLTGVDDGDAQKTINIITKPGRNTGQFGKIYAGYGTPDEQFNNHLYLGGGNVNFFNGARRVSIIAMTNNINQQNFSTDDLMGVVGTSSGQNRGGGSRGGGRGGSRGGSRGGIGGGGDAGNFLTNQQAGITKTNSVGLNYSDEWGEKVKVSGSYFFNSTDNTNNTSLKRNYFAGESSNLVYDENSTSTSTNINHRANLRLEYEIDSANTLIFTPRVSFQDNESNRHLDASTRLPDSTLVNSTDNTITANNQGYNIGGDLTYRHKFAKRGRTISARVNAQMTNRAGDGSTLSQNFYNDLDSTGSFTTNMDQRYDLDVNNKSISGNITYSEPINERSQLMVNYAPSFSNNTSERITRNKVDGDYTAIDPFLSNSFDNTYNSHRGGLTYRYNEEKINFNVGANYQSATLEGNQQYPTAQKVNATFSNILPQAMINYKFSRTKNLRLMYRTRTNAPSINQLQNVIDVTNPLLVRTGNPNLEQDYQHSLMLRYGNTNTATSTSFFAMAFANYVQDYIGNMTVYPSGNIPLDSNNTVILNEGSQLTRPMNLDGYFSARSFLTYGMPVRAIKSNLNMNFGLSYNRLPALIKTGVTTYEDVFNPEGGQMNIANNYTVNGGLVLSSNISENVDFTLSYSGYYNIVKNTIQEQANNNYYNQNTSFRLNWILQNRIVANTTLNHTLYTGISQGFNQSYLLWNASIGYKFLPDRSLDIRLSANDILNQNRSIEREVTDTYIEDRYTNVLQRYFMLNATYTIRRFAGANAATNNTTDLVEPAPGGRRQGGGEGGGGRRQRPE